MVGSEDVNGPKGPLQGAPKTPLQPPPVVPAFLLAVAGCTYNSDVSALDNAAEQVQRPAVDESGAWVLASVGDKLTHATYLLLKAGTANADGSFTSGATSYWLENASGWATPQAK